MVHLPESRWSGELTIKNPGSLGAASHGEGNPKHIEPACMLHAPYLQPSERCKSLRNSEFKRTNTGEFAAVRDCMPNRDDNVKEGGKLSYATQTMKPLTP